MKYILAIITFVIISNCQNSAADTAKIKKEITRHYTTRTNLKTTEKKELELHVEAGFDEEENQTYGINYLINPKDTIWYTSKNSKRKIENKTCFFHDSTLVYCSIKKKDTIRLFYPPEIDKPASYLLYDKKGAIGGIYPSLHENYPYIKSVFTDRKFDAKGDLTYYLITEFYLPKEFNIESNQKHLTQPKDLFQANSSKIVEMEYEYYE